ncbi:hypothetical protein G4Y79_22475 [Phototrophicus methaneseepsis]|uniref:Uncharacterized protein n=1 Tax=Phototrophicus methaneseepsis TaxID=2710758 RepID=A0A7S8E8V7_9CHLR|nr:hypothetical protein [Phototrophicus methaneseepsis]QPC82418.1 hypothetical protein G4Y79_22475 [Phototrophicus methaneseepsis]
MTHSKPIYGKFHHETHLDAAGKMAGTGERGYLPYVHGPGSRRKPVLLLNCDAAGDRLQRQENQFIKGYCILIAQSTTASCITCHSHAIMAKAHQLASVTVQASIFLQPDEYEQRVHMIQQALSTVENPS